MRSLAMAGVILATVLVLQPVAAAPLWEPAIPGVPPGGFASVTVEGVSHGDRNVSPNIRLRVRSDKERTAILVKLNGNYLTTTGQRFKSLTTNPTDVPQWEFVETLVYEIPITGLAPGVHHLEIRDGIAGSSLPIVNEHDIWFSVGE